MSDRIADRILLSEFLAGVWTEWIRRHGGSQYRTDPERLAHSLVDQLDKIEYWPRCRGEVLRAAAMAETWGGDWVERAYAIRDCINRYQDSSQRRDEELSARQREVQIQTETQALRREIDSYGSLAERDLITLEAFLDSFPYPSQSRFDPPGDPAEGGHNA